MGHPAAERSILSFADGLNRPARLLRWDDSPGCLGCLAWHIGWSRQNNLFDKNDEGFLSMLLLPFCTDCYFGPADWMGQLSGK